MTVTLAALRELCNDVYYILAQDNAKTPPKPLGTLLDEIEVVHLVYM